MSETAMLPAAPPERTAGRASAALEWLLLGLVLAAGGLTLTAGPPPGAETALAEPVGLFFRRVLLGLAPVGGWRVIPWGGFCAVLAAVLLLQALLPRVRADVRGGTAALGMLFLLAPVVHYRAQIEALNLPVDVAAEFGVPALTAFNPFLLVSWPLAVALLALAGWALATPSREWPPAVGAAAWVTLVLGGGGAWINRELLAARGRALDLHLYQWPYAMGSIWMVVHVGVAAACCGAVGRDPLRSRLLAVGVAALLMAAAVVGGGR